MTPRSIDTPHSATSLAILHPGPCTRLAETWADRRPGGPPGLKWSGRKGVRASERVRLLQGCSAPGSTRVDAAPPTSIPAPLYDTLDGSQLTASSGTPEASRGGADEESFVRHMHGLTFRGPAADRPVPFAALAPPAPAAHVSSITHILADIHGDRIDRSATAVGSPDAGALPAAAVLDPSQSTDGAAYGDHVVRLTLTSEVAPHVLDAVSEARRIPDVSSHSGALTPRLMETDTAIESHAILDLTPLTEGGSPDTAALAGAALAPGSWLLGDSSSDLDLAGVRVTPCAAAPARCCALWTLRQVSAKNES